MNRLTFRPLAAGLFIAALTAPVHAQTPPTLPPAPTATPTPSPASPAPPPVATDRLAYKITLTDGVRSVTRTRKDLGIQVASESPVRLTADLTALKGALARLDKVFHQEATNAKPYVYQGQVHVDSGTYSRTLNVPTTAQRFTEALTRDPALHQFTVSLDKKPPVLTAERLQGITGVLGTMTTRTSDDDNRNTNVGIAVEKINGTLLSPAEVFSLNQTVGERTVDSGFKEAPVFVNAKKVPGIGGGVSQVTGTLFNAAALSGLQIVEVNPHSRPVAYLPLGRDATVAWGDKDLKFKNNTQAPVYVAMTFAKNRLTATFYGAKVPGRKIVLKPLVKRLGAGKINATLYRVISENGKTIEKAPLFHHAYRWEPGG